VYPQTCPQAVPLLCHWTLWYQERGGQGEARGSSLPGRVCFETRLWGVYKLEHFLGELSQSSLGVTLYSHGFALNSELSGRKIFVTTFSELVQC
jgi:hypothetical protein